MLMQMLYLFVDLHWLVCLYDVVFLGNNYLPFDDTKPPGMQASIFGACPKPG